MIEVKGLTKKYGEAVAIKDISFAAGKGEIIGLLGPNGAGKTTTLNIITGYLEATDGTALINSIDISEEPEKAKKHIGYLPDVPPLYPEMTVREYLNFVAALKGVSKADAPANVDYAMELSKIEDVPNKLIRTLSKGYKQRVGLAQAIVGRPQIIILDEPTSGLDPRQIIEMRDVIKNLGKEHTILLSSHILHEVSTVCDRVIIINKGKTVASGSMDELSETLLAGSRIFVKVKGSTEAVATAFSEIDSVPFTVDSNEDGTLCDVVFSGTAAVSVREEIFGCVVKNNLTLLELTPATMSLEDIFLEITSKNEDSESECDSLLEDFREIDMDEATEGGSNNENNN